MTEYRWWRLNDIKETAPSGWMAVAEIIFYDENKNNLITDSNKAISKNSYSPTEGAFRAFDGDPDSICSAKGSEYAWWIGYVFDTPKDVRYVGIINRRNLPVNLKREWQSAILEASEDGIEWVFIGSILPASPPEYKELIICPLASLATLSVNYNSNYYNINPSITNSSGVYKGVVTEEKVPISAEVSLYNKTSGCLIGTSISNDSGFFEFIGLDPTRDYFAVSIHPRKEFNSIITDILIKE